MLTASEYPEVLGRLGREQRESKAKFQNLIRPLSQKEQRQVYELTRYPPLLQSLAGSEKLSKKDIKALTSHYPESVQKAALDVGRKKHTLMQQVNALNLASKAQFESALVGIPADAQQSFRQLLQIPELLSSMEENLPLTQAMGAAYRADPVGLQKQLSTYEAEAETRNNEAVSAFQSDLQENPQVAKEMREVAQEYSDAEGYDLYEVDQAPSQTQVYVNINPYPYWFGGPWWYPYSYWRPYPYWWGLGFYFGPGWGIGFWGYPSYYYTNWYYGYYGHFYRYPYLSSYYWRHYNNYRYRYGYQGNYWRGYRNGFYRGVDNWYRNNGRDYFPNRYVKDGHNPQRWSDYGKRENRYHKDRDHYGSNQVRRADYFPRSRQGDQGNHYGSRQGNRGNPNGNGPDGRGNRQGSWDHSQPGRSGNNRNWDHGKNGDNQAKRGNNPGQSDRMNNRRGSSKGEPGNVSNRSNRGNPNAGNQNYSGRQGSAPPQSSVQNRSRSRSSGNPGSGYGDAAASRGGGYQYQTPSTSGRSSGSGSYGNSRGGSWGGYSGRSSSGGGFRSSGGFGGGGGGRGFGGGGHSRGR